MTSQNGWEEYRKLVEDHMEKTNNSLQRIEARQTELAMEMARSSWMTKVFGVAIAAAISGMVNYLWPHK